MKLLDDQNHLKPSIAAFLILWLSPVLVAGMVRLWARSMMQQHSPRLAASLAFSNEMILVFVGTLALFWGLTLLASFWTLRKRKSDAPNTQLYENKGLE